MTFSSSHYVRRVLHSSLPGTRSDAGTAASRARLGEPRRYPSASLGLVALIASSVAYSQAESGNVLEEVVVTASRQSEVASRVPISMTAVTQQSMDQQGIQSVQDLSRSVPAISFRGTGTADTAISIRGIISGLGAATTGVYLDDTPIQKRLANGVNSGNGNAYPQLFDLERVEVLRGPQGTLYGGSSEGGTVRFITPAPNLERNSVFARTQVSTTEGGALSYGMGIAVGGPIIPGKLGVRVSLEDKRNGGYMDHVSIYTGQEIAADTNYEDARTIRLAMTWAPTANFRLTPSYYESKDFIADGDTFWQNVPQYTVKGGTFNNSGTIYGVPYSFPNKVLPAMTQGPFNQFGYFKTPIAYYPTQTNPQLQTSPRTITLAVSSLTLDYDFENVSLKSITSRTTSANKGYNAGQFGLRSAVIPTSITGNCGQGSATLNYAGGCAPLIFPGFPNQYSIFNYENRDRVVTQEVRLASKPGSGRLGWLTGVFYSDSRFKVGSDQFNNEDALTQFLRGMPEAYFVGQRPLPGDALGGNFAHRAIDIKEKETALFGEANYLLTDTFKVIAGVRVSRHEFDYEQVTAGPVFAPVFGFTGTTADPFPNATNGNNGYVTSSGSTLESPVTPKVGVSYQANDRLLFYATAAKGYRAGGVNVPANPVQCAVGLAAIGGVPPNSYKSDSVWSYEAGNKSTLFDGRAQVDTSVYYISWKDPQISQSFPTCGYSYIANAGSAVSKGMDLQTQFRLFSGLSLNLSVAYTDARYTETIRQPGGTSVVVNDGDELGAPKWQYSAGGQYTFKVSDRINGYVRADYRYASDYQRGGAAGTTSYDPITARGDATRFANARAGVTLERLDLALFVNNLTNSRDLISVGHGNSTPLITGSTYRPRGVGLQATYRY